MINDIEWKMVKLGDVATIIRGGSPRPIEDYITDSSNGINWIKIGDVAVGAKYIEHTEEKIISEGLYKSRSVKAGDFLLSNSMSFGRPYILRIDGAIHDGWLAIQDYNDTFEIEYLYYVLLTDFVLDQYKSMAAGSSVLNLNKQIVGKVNIPLPFKNGAPDLETQKQIAQKLGDMDSLIASKEKLLAKKRNLKVAAMQKLIKDEEGENWKKVKLGDSCKIGDGLHGTPTDDDYGNCAFFINGNNLVNGSINITDGTDLVSESFYKKKKINFSNDTVFLSINGTIGNVALYSGEKIILGKSVAYFDILKNLETTFLYYVLQSDLAKKYFENLLTGSTIKNLGLTGLRELKIPIPYKNGTPDLNEQRRIASILSDMDCEIAAIEKEITKLQNLKTAMMQKMFCFGDSNSSSE